MRPAILAAVLAVLALRWACADEQRERHHGRYATFNIEQWPKDERQVEAAFAEMKRLDADVIAVQEIRDPARFAREARARLGDHWVFLHADTAPDGWKGPSDHLGALVNTHTYAWPEMTVHQGTRLGGRHKPTVQIDLELRGEIGRVAVFVVHFKSGTEGRMTRHAQFAALTEIVRAWAPLGGDVVVMGDFNATEAGDREDLVRLARETKLQWATASLGCTAFWARRDGCPTSRLDHVLTSEAPTSVSARGACAEGCRWRPACPVYAHEVSDHCPVAVSTGD
jgi:endonuclease/exonuclease/phosphatase family metal-dependent hydrolase